MIPKATLKFIKSLQLKKYRKLEQCFVVEGDKGVTELLHSDYEVVMVACTPAFHDLHKDIAKISPKVWVTSEKHLVQAGSLKSNEHALAVARMKPDSPLPDLSNAFTLMLDEISDPGNLGTIIRTCDWFGVEHIIASETTTDVYSPKVIHATMGSFCRVQVHYASLKALLKDTEQEVYGAFLQGDPVHTLSAGRSGVIIVGSESRGISPEVAEFVTKQITIPKFGQAESLNVAIATGIIFDNVMRLKK
jgi:TrmH family RNA methyltransferase